MKRRILIVEDELLIAGNLERILVKHGYEVSEVAMDYQQAESFLKTNTCDLVLLDVNLSGKNSGVDLAHLINKSYQIPFMYITSYTDDKTIAALSATHPQGYLSKPIHPATFTTNVDLLFDRLDQPAGTVNIQVGATVYKYDLDEVLYAQADHVYTRLFHKSGSELLRISLNKLQEQFPGDELVRVNRSVAVNVRAVTRFDKTMVCVNDDPCFKISRSLVDDVHELFNK